MNKMNTTWLKWLALFSIATFLGFFFASQSYLSYLYRGYEANFMTSLQFILPDWYVWALFTPLIVWLARRLRFGREHWLRNVFVHLFVGLLVTVAKMFVLSLLTGWIPWLPHRPWSLVQTHPNLVTYWVILGLSHGFDYYRKFREKELRTSQLEGRLAKTQLQVLKMQLQPHFLFNTLHAISALMHKDVEAADRMMARLSDLLRLTLENTGVHEVSLKQELEFLQGYLEIEQTRFKDRLSIRTEIDPETLDARVPNLLLQPLVENAIRHGIEPYKRAGKVEILTKRSNGRLQVIIRDDGPGLANGKKPFEEGIGLSNTRARLEQLYGQNFELELGCQNEHGFVVNLSIPLILATDLH
ncbi:MAG: sensor histidine kinase [bacterium]